MSVEEKEDITTMSNQRSDRTIEFWNERWESGSTPWCYKASSLLRHVDKLLDGREHIRIFVPLCGKTVDMKWLADKGHTVVGVEHSRIPVEAFFNEHSLEFTRQPVNQLNGFLYKSTTLPISLYCCDIMEFPKAGEEHFDAVWDRGSLHVFKPPDDRQRYVEIVCSQMSDDCRYLLEVFDYEKHARLVPPHSLQDADIQQLFGDKFTCSKLSTEEDEERRGRLTPQSQYFHVCCWLLTWK